MRSNLETVDIRDESIETEIRFRLYIDGCPRGMVTRGRDKRVLMHWHPAGPFQFQESKVWVQGLLELSVIADKLESEVGRGQN